MVRAIIALTILFSVIRSAMPIKASISSLLRKLHLLPFAEKIWYGIQKIKNRKQNQIFRRKNGDMMLPPDFYVYETYRLNLNEYYYDGKDTAAEITDLVSRHQTLSDADIRVLDWGCGPGRIVRHLPALLPAASIYGTDYNKNYISWCQTHLRGIKFSVNPIDPPADYENGFFDLIIGISIFTHLSASNHEAWINELYRLIKPGGLAFITTQGAAFRSVLGPSEKQRFDKDELVIRDNVREGNRLFSAFQPQALIRKLVEGKFEIVEFLPAIGDTLAQDIWLFRKIS